MGYQKVHPWALYSLIKLHSFVYENDVAMHIISDDYDNLKETYGTKNELINLCNLNKVL